MEKIQLICFSYAGSVASNFNLLKPYLGDEVILSVVEYRGRGNRSKEKDYRDNDDMISDAAEQIRKIREHDVPYAILGYSMGAQVIYELFARGFIEEMPVCVLVAAHMPPDIDCTGKGIDLEDSEKFLEVIKKYGGLDERLLQDKRFASIFLSRMKTDFRLLKDYQFNGIYYKFPVRIVVMYSEEDTPYQLVQGWKRFAGQEILFYQMGEGHFFYRTDSERFCRIITTEIGKRAKNK